MFKLFLIEGIKMKWQDLKIFFYLKFFHKNHVFLRSEVTRSETDPACQLCGKTLSSLPGVKGTLIALLLLALPARADFFVGAKKDTTFYRDSAYSFRVALEGSDCTEARPCLVQVEDDRGSMADVAASFHGAKGDTVGFSYAFPASRYHYTTTTIRLSIWNQYGRSLGGWTAGLGFSDPKPPLGLKARPRGSWRALPTLSYRLDGRRL